MLQRDREEVVARVRHVPGEQLVEDDPEGVDVRLGVDPLAPRLLGGDVVARAEHGAGLRAAADGLERAGDPEIGDLGLPVAVHEHVLRLHVAVDQALLVSEGERASDLQTHLEDAANRHRPASDDEILQRLALHELEDDELTAVRLAAVDHGDDSGMRELSGGPCLVPEPRDVVVVLAEMLVEDLQRDVALELRVVRAVDRRHPALADGVLELVALRDPFVHRRHGTVPPLEERCARGSRRVPLPRPPAPRRARRP